MTLDEYNAYCSSLPQTTHVVQWSGSHVWKVGGKVFAMGRAEDGKKQASVTFKVSPLAYDMLKEEPGLRPAPYLASRGMKWIQRFGRPGLNKKDLKAYIAESHKLVAAGLTKKKQRELGLLAD